MKAIPRASQHLRPLARKAIVVAAVVGMSFTITLLASPPSLNGQRTGGVPGSQVQNPFPAPPATPSPSPTVSPEQRQGLLKYNFKQMKKHADDLAGLAKDLQKDIEQSNENVLSLEIVKKAEKIEKLAKKIKNEAKGD
jgi:hypothetical protein